MTLTKGNVDYHEVMQWLNTVHLPEVAADIAGIGPPSPTFVPAYYSPQQFGAVADGSSHPLSGYYASLAAAQVDFPFATALTQQIDYCATKKASNMAFGSEYVGPGSFATPDDDSTVSVIKDVSESWTVNEHAGKILSMRYPNGFIHQVGIASNTATQLTLASALPYDFHNPDVPGSVCGFVPPNIYPCSQYAIGAGEHGDTNAKHNRPLYFPAGTYVFGDDTWLIRNLSGGHIYGAGRRAVRLTSNATVFQTDGLWYSRIEGITFEKLVANTNPCVDIDGNVPGHPYATRSVQANTFYQCQFDGGGSQIAFALNRQGGSSAQGENSYIECHWINATVCYYQNGFNALANIMIRGDMQDFTTGVYLLAGSINIYGMSFESTHGYSQITDTSFIAHGGFDIDCSASGVGERIVVQGVRSESLRFFRGSSAQVGVLIGCYQLDGGASTWSATTAYSLNQYVRKSVTIGGNAFNKMFRVTTAGTSGGTEPTWPTSGTVSDGSVVWTLTEFNVVDASTSGQLYLAANSFQLGNIRQGPTGGGSGGSLSAYPPFTREVTGVSAYTATRDDEFILVDTSAGNVTITLPINNSTPSVPPIGKRYYIKKYSTDANTVTVVGDDTANMDGDGFATVIPGGSRGWIAVELSAGGNLTQRYWVIDRSFGVGTNPTTSVVPYNNAGTFADSPLIREDANTISQRNGANKQSFSVYRDFTDATHYERLRIYNDASNIWWIEAHHLNGSNRPLNIQSGGILNLYANAGADVWRINASGWLESGSTNNLDVGGWARIGANAGFRSGSTPSNTIFVTDNNMGTAPGALSFKQPVIAKTSSPESVTVDETGFVFTNAGASGAMNFNLPAATKGLSFTFYVDATQTVTATATNSNTIREGSTVSASNGNIASGATKGSTIKLTCFTDGEWVVEYRQLTWTIT